MTIERGDRVKVTDSNAPFCGSSGVVTRRGGGVSEGPYRVWMVKLDGLAAEVAHYEKELELCEQWPPEMVDLGGFVGSVPADIVPAIWWGRGDDV